jgi:hypothetical protein
MNRYFFTFSIILIASGFNLIAQTPPLWQKAVTIQSENLNWTPGTMTMKFELLDKKGRAEMVDVTKYKLAVDENGESTSEMVSAFHDGEDVTEKRKTKIDKDKAKKDKKGEKNGENNVGFDLEESPLHPDNQNSVSVTALDQSKSIDGKSCKSFEYSMPLDESTKTGTVWIDAETGAPVLHEFTTTPLPPRMKEMNNTVKFTYTPDKKFYISEMMFNGVGGILIIKKSFRGTMTFEEYWENKSSDL